MPRIALSKNSVLGLGIALLLIGLLSNTLARAHAFNDYAYIHVLGKMLLAGADPYDYAARQGFAHRIAPTWKMDLQPYLPAAALIQFPLILLPLNAASYLLLFISMGVLLAGLWTFLRVFAPQTRRETRVLLLGLTLCSIAVRQNLYSLQSGVLVAGLLCFYMAALKRSQERMALFCSIVALCLKVTNGLPFLALALLQKRFKLAGGMLAFFIVINIIGFARAGGITSVHQYAYDVSQIQRSDRIDTDDPRQIKSLTRLDWTYWLNGCGLSSAQARPLGLGLGASAMLWLLWQGSRARRVAREDVTLLAFVPPLACLDILIVYHHYYESVLLIPAVFSGYVLALSGRGVRAFYGFAALVVGYFGFTPRVVFERHAEAYNSLPILVMVRLIGATVLLAAFLVSLRMLSQVMDGRSRNNP